MSHADDEALGSELLRMLDDGASTVAEVAMGARTAIESMGCSTDPIRNGRERMSEKLRYGETTE